MRIGLALPQYDYSVPGPHPLEWDPWPSTRSRAERLGYDSLWLSDHLFLDIEKYGGPATRHAAFEPLVTLAALARTVSRPRLGTLVVCEALRPATVLAKALATLDRISGGRLDVGIGAGWYEPEYEAIGLPFPSPGERLDRLDEAVQVVPRPPRRRPAHVRRPLPPRRRRAERPAHRSSSRARPSSSAGRATACSRLAAEYADGWNTCWVWTPDAYRERLDVLDRACERVRRDPATVWRSLGLYALCGRTRPTCIAASSGCARPRRRSARPEPLEEWRQGRLVGTVEQVREQARAVGRRSASRRSSSAPARSRSRSSTPTMSRSWPRRS